MSPVIFDKINLAWKRTPTPEIQTRADQLADEAYAHGYDLDLTEILFLAFKAGYEAVAAQRACTLDNAAETILDRAAAIIDFATADTEGDQGFAKYLILKDLWNRLTELMRVSADDLREKAEEMEEEARTRRRCND